MKKEEQGFAKYDHQTENLNLHALYRASTYAMRVTSGKKALQLFITSSRIQGFFYVSLNFVGDLEIYANGTMKEEFNVIVREFRTFDPDLEFRGFIYQSKFTALTQYNNFVAFPLLQAEHDYIVKLITKEFEDKIFPKIALKNYVLDFVLCAPTEEQYHNQTAFGVDRLKNLKVFVVEINPMAEFAGSGLFSWEKDKDVLLGFKPFEFRYVTQVDPFAIEQISPEWKSVLPK